MKAILLPLSWLYGLVVTVRNWCYDRNIFQTVRAGVPVISAGNITAGGTGKTPVVEYMLSYFLKKGKKVAVLSRGYGRSTSGMLVVSDGHRVSQGPGASGDEPFQIAGKFPGAVVIVDEKRSRAAMYARRAFAPDVILLDDGFQHRRLARDLDIVLIDGRKNLESIQLLPAGLRREPVSSLGRASLLAFSRSPATQSCLDCVKRYTQAPMVEFRLRPVRLRELYSGTVKPVTALKGKECLAFSGIGNPDAFTDTLKEAGLKLSCVLKFPDHYAYRPSDMRKIQEEFVKTNAQAIVTTEKDSVRIRPVKADEDFPVSSLFFMEVEAEVTVGELIFQALLDGIVKGVKSC